MQPTDEADLIAAVVAGDRSAFEHLIGRYQGRVHRLIGRFTRDPGEIEDLCQEVFVKVYRKLDSFQRDSAFFTWLYRIAVNTATDYLSRRRRRLRLVGSDEALDDSAPRDDEGEGALQPLLDEEVRRVTREVLQGLPEPYRNILVLREYEELSYTEMAKVLGCSIGTVESRLFRARQRFKDALARLHPELVPQLGGKVVR